MRAVLLVKIKTDAGQNKKSGIEIRRDTVGIVYFGRFKKISRFIEYGLAVHGLGDETRILPQE